MASPVADSYSSASGAGIYGGRFSTPAWLSALSATTWTQIGSNVITGINPANDAAINPNYPSTAPWASLSTLGDAANQWSGGALDDVNGRFWFCGGGHAGYLGNEVYSIDLDSDSPAWARRGYPSGSIQFPCANLSASGADNSLSTDGRPAQVHTYNLLTVGNNGDLCLMPSGYNYAGNAVAHGHIFSHSASDWTATPVFVSTAGGNAGGACYDPVRNKHWLFSGQYLESFAADGTATSHINTWGSLLGYYSRLIYDTTRNLIVMFAGDAPQGEYSGASILFIDPANPTTITIAPQSVAQFQWGSLGIDYDAAADRYLVWDGTAMTVITPPATSPGTNTWTHSTLSLTGAPSDNSSNGTWGRFRVSAKYGCAFLLNSTTQQLWALKLH